MKPDATNVTNSVNVNKPKNENESSFIWAFKWCPPNLAGTWFSAILLAVVVIVVTVILVVDIKLIISAKLVLVYIFTDFNILFFVYLLKT